MRAAIIGASGSGKTTFARRLAARLECAFVELDAIYNQAGWTHPDEEEFRARVADALAGDTWVCDGNYSTVHPLIRDRATDVVWIDPPKLVVMSQVVWRSASRALRQAELWNGNRERFRDWIDPEHPIRWAWSSFEKKRADYAARMTAPEYRHVRFHRFRTRDEASAFVAAVEPLRD